MLCDKCGLGCMFDDSQYDIRVYKCWACGNRIYLDYPKRRGSLVCSRCDNDIAEDNGLGYCKDCVKLLGIHVDRVKISAKRDSVRARSKFIRRSPKSDVPLQ